MYPHKVVMGEMERNGGLKVFKLLTESVCKRLLAPVVLNLYYNNPALSSIKIDCRVEIIPLILGK